VICDLFSKAVPRLKRKQLEVGLFEDIHLIFDLPSGSFGVIDLMELEFCKVNSIEEIQNYQRFKLDPRLLRRVLTGPHLANWNNIEIGAHLDFERKPDVFRQNIHILVNALHV
jgi:UDP-MurNAc hydroxylase